MSEERVSITFDRRSGKYGIGDVAGFRDDIAEAYVKSGAAHYTKVAKKQMEASEPKAPAPIPEKKPEAVIVDDDDVTGPRDTKKRKRVTAMFPSDKRKGYVTKRV